MASQVRKLVIIGSGPAGLTAAIYAARGGLNPLVVTGHEVGGQLLLATEIEDFPGFPQGIKGVDLMAKLKEQASRFQTEFLESKVSSADFSQNPLIINTEAGDFLTQTVILATGSTANWLGLPSEKKLIGKGVSACAVCDGPFFKNKQVVIVGGGDVAMKEALYLSKFASNIAVIHRRDILRAQEALQQQIKTHPNIKLILNSTVEDILGEEKVVGVKIKNTKTEEMSEMPTDGIFLAIGSHPNTEFLKGQIDLDETGHIKVFNSTKTSVKGVFAAGDVADLRYRQAVTAAASGCKAALDVEEYLRSTQ